MRSSIGSLMLQGVAVVFYGPTFVCGQTQPGDDFAAPPGVAGSVSAAAVDATQIDLNAAIPTLIMPPDGSDSSTIFLNPTLGRGPGGSMPQGNPPTSKSGGNIVGLTAASTFGGNQDVVLNSEPPGRSVQFPYGQRRMRSEQESFIEYACDLVRLYDTIQENFTRRLKPDMRSIPLNRLPPPVAPARSRNSPRRSPSGSD